MTENMKPCPKCKAKLVSAEWVNSSGAPPYTWYILCRGCGVYFQGSTVRKLTAASKASAWRRTKAKWNKIPRCKKCGGTGLYVGQSMGGAVFDLDCDECESIAERQAT